MASKAKKDAKGLRKKEAYRKRLNLVFSKLPKDGRWVSAGELADKLIDNKRYNRRDLDKSKLISRINANLQRLEKDNRVERYVSGVLTFWACAGTNMPHPEPRVNKKDLYPRDSWETKVLEALRNQSAHPLSIDEIVDRILGIGSYISPLDSEIDREECEDGVYSGLSQLLSDEAIIEHTSKGIKDGTYSEV